MSQRRRRAQLPQPLSIERPVDPRSRRVTRLHRSPLLRRTNDNLPRRPPVLNHLVHERQKNKQNSSPHYHVKVKICPSSKINLGLPKNIPSKYITKEWFRKINENTRFSYQLDIAILGNFYFPQE